MWRSNVAVDRRLPGGFVSTTEYLYAKDVNGIYYINANLPAAQSTFAGVDNRPRWVGTPCVAAGNPGGCATRINSEPGNVVGVNYVLKNGAEGNSWNFAQSLSEDHGVRPVGPRRLQLRRVEVDLGPGIHRGHQLRPQQPLGRSEQPGLEHLAVVARPPRVRAGQLHRAATSTSGRRRFRRSGRRGTSTNGSSSRLSYTFAGDMNGDSISANDLIYIPRDQSEMNFSAFTVGTRTFTAAEQAAAFDAYIQQDPYLSKNRGQYAERNGLVMPMFRSIGPVDQPGPVPQHRRRSATGSRSALDIVNFGNLLNSNWGVSQRPVGTVNFNNQLQILTNPAVDAQGRSTYRLGVVNNELIKNTFQTAATTSDVYQFMLSLRYSFN